MEAVCERPAVLPRRHNNVNGVLCVDVAIQDINKLGLVPAAALVCTSPAVQRPIVEPVHSQYRVADGLVVAERNIEPALRKDAAGEPGGDSMESRGE